MTKANTPPSKSATSTPNRTGWLPRNFLTKIAGMEMIALNKTGNNTIKIHNGMSCAQYAAPPSEIIP